jgi:glycerophosphoryl diester phosphodiesterase
LPEAEKFFDVSAFAYGHRGLWSGDVPENSLAAFQSARTHQIGVELDVRLTSDGAPVVFHDATLERMCGDIRALDQVSARELEEILLPDGSRVPTLTQVLEVMSGLPVLLELKVDRPGDTAVVDVVASALKDRGGMLAAMSFDEPTVARLCHLIKDRPIGLLIDAEARIGVDAVAIKATKARAMGCDYLAPHLSSLSTASGHSGGLPLVTWTLRAPSDLELARKYAAAPIFEGFSPSLVSGLAKPPGTPI